LETLKAIVERKRPATRSLADPQLDVLVQPAGAALAAVGAELVDLARSDLAAWHARHCGRKTSPICVAEPVPTRRSIGEPRCDEISSLQAATPAGDAAGLGRDISHALPPQCRACPRANRARRDRQVRPNRSQRRARG